MGQVYENKANLVLKMYKITEILIISIFSMKNKFPELVWVCNRSHNNIFQNLARFSNDLKEKE